MANDFQKKTSKHLVLRSVHPSPLSASRGFFNCGHFRKTNDWLTATYGSASVIDWRLEKNDNKERSREENFE